MPRLSERSWSNLTGQHRGQLETPVLCLDLERYQSRVFQTAAFWKVAEIEWLPSGQELSVSFFMECVLAAGVNRLDCRSVYQGADFATAGARQLHLSEIVVGDTLLQSLQELCGQCQVTLICDHYAQAEMLSDVGEILGQQLPVLMEVNLGRDQCGVRPGVDARDLAKGLRQLPGIGLAGLSGTLGALTFAQAADQDWVASRVKLLTSLLDEIPHHHAPRISISASGAISGLAAHESITEIRSGSLLDPCDLAGGGAPLSLLATVISRSKLERAVVNAGRLHCGGSVPVNGPFEVASGRPLPDAAVESVSDNQTTLILGPQSLDLIIGDSIVLPVPESQMALQQHVVLLGVRNGVVEQQWAL